MKKDEESGETTVEVDGVQDVVMVQDAKPKALGAAKPGGPLKAPSHDPGTVIPASQMVNNDNYNITMNLFDYVATDGTSNHYGACDGAGINSGKNQNTQLQFYGYGSIGTGINNFVPRLDRLPTQISM